MKQKLVQTSSEAATGAKLAATVHQPEPEGFLSADNLLERLPISRGTLFNWRKAGKIPSIEIGGRVLFDWPSVQQAILRQQRQGAE